MKLDQNLERPTPLHMVHHLALHVAYIHNKGRDVYFQSEFF